MHSGTAIRFHFHRCRHELGNYAALRLPRFDGAIVSMHQSGTHWLKYMLANAMSAHYGLPPPRYNHANDIIGGTRDPRPFAYLPHLVSTHSIPPLVCTVPWVARTVRWPPVVLLVRDLRWSLVSNFRKWETRYATTFSAFLRGDPSGRRFNSDIWWCLRFQNAWGRVAAHAGEKIHVVRYEDLRADPAQVLARVAGHLRLPLTPAQLRAGAEAATKQTMAARADPVRPPGEVNFDDADGLARYDAADREFVRACTSRWLRYAFGYDYSRW